MDKSSFYKRYGKRLFDSVTAGVALLLLAPLLALIAIMLFFTQGLPVLFRQVRPGLAEQPFAMLKFRTMNNRRDPDSGELLPDSKRVTTLGAALRRTSLDELPELWNVLLGSMSLVGPRPLLMDYLSHYTDEQRRRHEVRPGITGAAQVAGRQNMLFSERFSKDVWYVDNVSFLLDIKILLQTVWQSLRGRGVITGQDVTAVDDVGVHAATRAEAARKNGGDRT